MKAKIKRPWPPEIAHVARRALNVLRSYTDLELDDEHPAVGALWAAMNQAWRWARLSSDRLLSREKVSRDLFAALGAFNTALAKSRAALRKEKLAAMYTLNRPTEGRFE